MGAVRVAGPVAPTPPQPVRSHSKVTKVVANVGWGEFAARARRRRCLSGICGDQDGSYRRMSEDIDLINDPEGQQIAKGLLQYVKSLAVLKDNRDHSKLNQHTPILSAGAAGR